MHATSFHHREATTLPPIRATIAIGQDEVQVRLSDQGFSLLLDKALSISYLFIFARRRINSTAYYLSFGFVFILT